MISLERLRSEEIAKEAKRDLENCKKSRVVFEHPEEIRAVIENRVLSALSKAPVLSFDEFNKEMGNTSENMVSLKIPEDSHLSSFLEAEVFRTLLEIASHVNPKEILVHQQTIMFFDPDLPKLFSKTATGLIIKGETCLSHELKHALAANEAGIDLSFINISFYWLDVEGQKRLIVEAKVVAEGFQNIPANKARDILMAPDHPSTSDFELMQTFEQSDTFQKMKLKLSIFLGNTTTGEMVLKRLFRAWRSYRKDLLPEKAIR